MHYAARAIASLFRWRKFPPLLFCRSNSFLLQPGLTCRFGNFRLFALLGKRHSGQHHFPQFVEAILDVARLIAIALACDDKLAPIVDSSTEFPEEPRAYFIRN